MNRMNRIEEQMRPYHVAAARSQAILFANVARHFTCAVDHNDRRTAKADRDPSDADRYADGLRPDASGGWSWADEHTYEAAQAASDRAAQRADWAAEGWAL